MKKKVLVVIPMILLLFSCGKQKIEATIEDDLPEEIIIKHQLDLNIDELKLLFTTGCENKFENQDEVDDCINSQVADLVNQLGKFLDTQDKAKSEEDLTTVLGE